MLEPAVTPLAPRPHRTSVIEGCAASWTLSRFLRPLLEHARAEERRRIARDLHDGAQQRLVHTILALKLAQQAGDADVARTLFDEALEEAQAAHTELRQLVRGIGGGDQGTTPIDRSRSAIALRSRRTASDGRPPRGRARTR